MNYDVADFETDVISLSYTIPVLVDFWADWCGPCKTLGPILEKLADQHNGEWDLRKVDTEKFPTIAAQYRVTSIPNVKLFVDGEVTDEFTGALPEPAIAKWLINAIPSKYKMQLDGAKELLLENRIAEAREILNMVTATEPDNEQALVLLAQSFLAEDTDRAVSTVKSLDLGSKHLDAAEAIRTLGDLYGYIDDNRTLPDERVKTEFLGAVVKSKANDFTGALEGFLEVIRKNRYYNEDGARKACVAIFSLLGDQHSITKRYSRTLSNILY